MFIIILLFFLLSLGTKPLVTHGLTHDLHNSLGQGANFKFCPHYKQRLITIKLVLKNWTTTNIPKIKLDFLQSWFSFAFIWSFNINKGNQIEQLFLLRTTWVCIAFSANIAVCNSFSCALIYEFDRSIVYSPLSPLWVFSETRSGTSISHWCCVKICKFSSLPWPFLASRYNFNSKFPYPNEVCHSRKTKEVDHILLCCCYISLVWTDWNSASMPFKRFSTPHLQKLTKTYTTPVDADEEAILHAEVCWKTADHRIYAHKYKYALLTSSQALLLLLL